jgi:hypothetical protein
MSIRHFALKSVILKGDLGETISYKLCPATEFSEGVWTIALNSITYTSLSSIKVKDNFSISCNLVKGQKISKSNEVESYDQPLTSFLFESEKKKDTIYLNKNWFQINAVSNELKFILTNEDQPNVSYVGKICLQVLFQRVL